MLALTYFIILTIFPVLQSHASSSTALNQLIFWSENVCNDMPEVLSSKLSPMSVHDSAYFSSLVSNPSFSLDSLFCSLANLACASLAKPIRPLSQAYQIRAHNHNSVHLSMLEDRSFFKLSTLKLGRRVHLPNRGEYSSNGAFLPKEIAHKIPLDSNKLKRVFPRSFDSKTTKDAIQETLFHCNAPNLEDEAKSCPTSLEDMIEFSKSILGANKLLALNSDYIKGTENQIIVENVMKYDIGILVPCHEVFLPFATYFCHLHPSTNIYAVDVAEPKTEDHAGTIFAICHMDTSKWPADHIAFEVLKTSPGEGEVCHWMAPADIVWIEHGAKKTKVQDLFEE